MLFCNLELCGKPFRRAKERLKLGTTAISNPVTSECTVFPGFFKNLVSF